MTARTITVAIACVATLACAPGRSSMRVASQDGYTWYRVECNRHERCAWEASDLCPHGYFKGEDTARGEGFNEDGSPTAAPQKHRVITVRCVSKKDER